MFPSKLRVGRVAYTTELSQVKLLWYWVDEAHRPRGNTLRIEPIENDVALATDEGFQEEFVGNRRPAQALTVDTSHKKIMLGACSCQPNGTSCAGRGESICDHVP